MYTCTFRGLPYPVLLGQRSQICKIAVPESGLYHSFVFRLSPVSGAFNHLCIYFY